MSRSTPIRSRVFISYSHADDRWLQRLKIHIATAVREEIIDYWDDTSITPGADWRAEIEQAIATARVAVLLISANFLAADFIAHTELPALLHAAEEEGAVVIPLILAPSRFTDIPSLSRFQSVNPPEKPLIKVRRYEQEQYLVKAAGAIIAAIEAAKEKERETASAHKAEPKAKPKRNSWDTNGQGWRPSAPYQRPPVPEAATAHPVAAAADEELGRQLVSDVRTALQNGPYVRAWPPTWEQERYVDYFYRSGSLLTRDRDLPRVLEVLRSLGALRDEGVTAAQGEADDRALFGGISRLGVHVRETQHIPEVVSDLDWRLGVGVATLDHAFIITPNTSCPATEPETVITPHAAKDPVAVQEALWPGVGDPIAGRDVRIFVVDTGLLSGAAAWAPWIEGVEPDTEADVEDPDQLKVDPMGRRRDGFADPYAGHGTFVSGVIRCIAPASHVVVGRMIEVSGFVYESSLIQQIHSTLSLARPPHIINMSAGGYTRGNLPSLAFQTLWEERLSQLRDTVLVAAAGNDGRTAPFWPAAFPWCVSVGSMTRDGQRRSPFSNHGDWIDVYAPGEDIVNAYVRMKYKTITDGEVRDTSAGIARWSGTSFATAIVSGLIASRMSRTREYAREAAEALLAETRSQFHTAVGRRLFP